MDLQILDHHSLSINFVLFQNVISHRAHREHRENKKSQDNDPGPFSVSSVISVANVSSGYFSAGSAGLAVVSGWFLKSMGLGGGFCSQARRSLTLASPWPFFKVRIIVLNRSAKDSTYSHEVPDA